MNIGMMELLKKVYYMKYLYYGFDKYGAMEMANTMPEM